MTDQPSPDEVLAKWDGVHKGIAAAAELHEALRAALEIRDGLNALMTVREKAALATIDDLRTQLAAERSNAEVLRKLLDDVERRAEKREAQLAEVTRERDIAIRELSKWSFEAGTLKAERDELARVTAELCIKIGEANHWMRHTDAYESCIKTIAALEAKLKSAT